MHAAEEFGLGRCRHPQPTLDKNVRLKGLHDFVDEQRAANADSSTAYARSVERGIEASGAGEGTGYSE